MEITSDPIVQQAIRAVLDLDLDAFERDCIFETALYPEHAQSPWIWCWRAMAQRIRYGDYTAAFHHAQRASELFALHNDQDGYARSVAEAAIACYHLGQYVAGLHLLTACPAPAQPSIASALALARYLNAIGLNDLAAALNAAEQGLRALAHEPETQRRVRWQIVLKRNLVPAYHYCGQLPMARQLADEALQLAEVHQIDDYHYHWILYERGLLEQRAGNLAHALQLLQQARTHCEHAAERNGTVSPLWRWIVAAEGHTLRDQGDLSAADACYQRSGWGEGEDGPLMLWLLQERWNEARCAAEARLTAAYASHATFESANLNVFVALLQSFQFGSTTTIHETLHQAADTFAALGFHYHRASVLLHLAAVEYDLNSPEAGDATLAEALRFGHLTGYYNFAWWHPVRMRNLLARALARSIEATYCQHLAAVRNIWSLDSASTMLSIRCLGQFELQINNQPIPLAHWQGHAAGIMRMQRLLLYLARHRQEQSINAIARYVWADRWNCIDRSANVHLTINGLRRVLEPHITQGSHSRFVLRGAFGYQLAPEIRVAIDLDVFAAQIALARKHDVFGQSDGVRGAYLQAEQVYGGDFALAKPSPDELEQYRTAYCEAVRWLATDDLRHERYAQCVRRAKRLLGEDPADQIASELLIEAAVELGEQQVARRAYERAIRAGVGVSPRIAALVRTKRR